MSLALLSPVYPSRLVEVSDNLFDDSDCLGIDVREEEGEGLAELRERLLLGGRSSISCVFDTVVTLPFVGGEVSFLIRVLCGLLAPFGDSTGL